MPTLEFSVDCGLEMVPGLWPNDMTNGISRLVSEAVGDTSIGSRWGGIDRTMEVFLSVTGDQVDKIRARLQSALDTQTIAREGASKPKVVIKQ